jgi:hypothetical protein
VLVFLLACMRSEERKHVINGTVVLNETIINVRMNHLLHKFLPNLDPVLRKCNDQLKKTFKVVFCPCSFNDTQ